ncbi:Chaperone protein dnaJ C76 [Hirschfeldia incana]|nr:Chaperone protein dnaJ C76 [Hirschfeldia incana]
MTPTILTPTTLPPSTTAWPCTTTPQKLTTIRSPFKLKCRATSSASSSSITDFDLYDLLGIDRSSDKSQIKAAYRNLQKRCHPDIAGVPGHDMAIILNEAYKLLSDPVSRQAYDKEQAKLEELRGYTGKPVYSVWCGPETEQRAVFVDEVKCVGCLKCALCAEKTFAIETAHGRARVVAQWADPESKIKEAIEACPIDCISMVERSDLAPLEFLMSKQPRGNVRIGVGNTVGERVSNVFVDVKKFQQRYAESMSRTTRDSSQESDLQREVRMSAVEAIRSISNWLYWRSSPYSRPLSPDSNMSLTFTKRKKAADPDIKKLQDAVAAMKQAEQSGETKEGRRRRPASMAGEDYWSPSNLALPSSGNTNTKTTSVPQVTHKNTPYEEKATSTRRREYTRQNFKIQKFPIGTATVAVFLVQFQASYTAPELSDHIGGSLALSIVNSPWQQILLAGVTWYFIGAMLLQLVEAIQSKQEDKEA